jgi:hypothetical protein
MSKKITQLPSSISVATTDILPVVILSGPTTKKITVAAIGEANAPGLNPALLAGNPNEALTVDPTGAFVETQPIVDLPLPITDLDPAAGADGNVLTLVAGAPTWGQLDLADPDAVTNQLPTGNVATILTSKTLADPTITGTVTYQGTRMRIISIPGEAQTVDATPTNVASFTILDETSVEVDFVVNFVGQTGIVKGGAYKGTVSYQRSSAGAPTIIGAAVYSTPQETEVNSVLFDVTGNVISAQAIAADTDGRNWTCELRVQETVTTP